MNIDDGKLSKIPISEIAAVLSVMYTVGDGGDVTGIRLHPLDSSGGVWDGAVVQGADAGVEGSLIVLKTGEAFLSKNTKAQLEGGVG